MSLSAFVRDHHEEIISRLAGFARTLMPPGADMTETELRDHAEQILTAVVHDMSISQTSEEQLDKSEGRGSANTMRASGRLHADDRIKHGFTFRSVLAEFRALRATVLSLYEESGATDITDVRRFNEATDESLTESMDRFAVQTDQFRDQFIGILSHDLRTPLGAITGATRLSWSADGTPGQRTRVGDLFRVSPGHRVLPSQDPRDVPVSFIVNADSDVPMEMLALQVEGRARVVVEGEVDESVTPRRQRQRHDRSAASAITVSFSGLGVKHADGRQFHWIGLAPETFASHQRSKEFAGIGTRSSRRASST